MDPAATTTTSSTTTEEPCLYEKKLLAIAINLMRIGPMPKSYYFIVEDLFAESAGIYGTPKRFRRAVVSIFKLLEKILDHPAFKQIQNNDHGQNVVRDINAFDRAIAFMMITLDERQERGQNIEELISRKHRDAIKRSASVNVMKLPVLPSEPITPAEIEGMNKVIDAWCERAKQKNLAKLAKPDKCEKKNLTPEEVRAKMVERYCCLGTDDNSDSSDSGDNDSSSSDNSDSSDSADSADVEFSDIVDEIMSADETIIRLKTVDEFIKISTDIMEKFKQLMALPKYDSLMKQSTDLAVDVNFNLTHYCLVMIGSYTELAAQGLVDFEVAQQFVEATQHFIASTSKYCEIAPTLMDSDIRKIDYIVGRLRLLTQMTE